MQRLTALVAGGGHDDVSRAGQRRERHVQAVSAVVRPTVVAGGDQHHAVLPQARGLLKDVVHPVDDLVLEQQARLHDHDVGLRRNADVAVHGVGPARLPAIAGRDPGDVRAVPVAIYLVGRPRVDLGLGVLQPIAERPRPRANGGLVPDVLDAGLVGGGAEVGVREIEPGVDDADQHAPAGGAGVVRRRPAPHLRGVDVRRAHVEERLELARSVDRLDSCHAEQRRHARQGRKDGGHGTGLGLDLGAQSCEVGAPDVAPHKKRNVVRRGSAPIGLGRGSGRSPLDQHPTHHRVETGILRGAGDGCRARRLQARRGG